MSSSSNLNALRAHIEKISPLTDAEWEYVSARFASRKIRKHQYLVQQGDPAEQRFHNLIKQYPQLAQRIPKK
jgi:hypothetical protein